MQRSKLENLWYWHQGKIVMLIIIAFFATLIIIGATLPHPSPPPDYIDLTKATTNHDCKAIKQYAENHIEVREDFNNAEQALKLENCP